MSNYAQYLQISLLDHKIRRKQFFSKDLVEPKRFGRTLPAIINGISASQAQSQGLVEDLTEEETGSTADSEPLFVEGDSEHERIWTRSRSTSPPKVDTINGDIPRLNPTDTPLNPHDPHGAIPFSGSQTYPIVNSSQSYAKALTPPGQAESTPSLKLKPQSPSIDYGDNDSPKFDVLPSKDANKSEEVTKKSGPSIKNSLPRFGGQAAIDAGQLRDVNNISENPQLTQSPTAKSNLNNQPTDTVSVPSLKSMKDWNPQQTSNGTSQRSLTNIFDKSSTSSAKTIISFGTSTLFRSSEAGERPEKRTGIVSSKFENATAKPPSLNPFSSNVQTTASIAQSKPGTDPDLSLTDSQKLFQSVLSNDPADNISTSPHLKQSQNLKTTSSFVPASPSTTDSLLAHGTSILPRVPTISARSNTPRSPLSLGAQEPRLCSGSDAVLDSTAIKIKNKQFEEDVVISEPSKEDSRSKIVDQLSEAIMLENKGLLQQFIEFSVEPIIKSSIARLEDQVSWDEAS